MSQVLVGASRDCIDLREPSFQYLEDWQNTKYICSINHAEVLSVTLSRVTKTSRISHKFLSRSANKYLSHSKNIYMNTNKEQKLFELS